MMVNSIITRVPMEMKMPGAETLSREMNRGKGPPSPLTAMDTVALQQSPAPLSTYSTFLHTGETVDKSYEMLRRLVTDLLSEQGIQTAVATADSEIDIAETGRKEAQELIAEDGYFSVERTSDRIVKFAMTAAGGDTGRLEAIKKGVENGFNEALQAFGGSLPDISHTTLDAVMEKLDAWAAGADGN